MLSSSGLDRRFCVFALKLLPLLAILLIVHPALLLISKLQLRCCLVLYLIIHNWSLLEYDPNSNVSLMGKPGGPAVWVELISAFVSMLDYTSPIL